MAQILLNLHGSGIILTAAIMLISGFLFTRLTKLAHLPNVTGYILSGVLIGPWCLHLVPQEYISQMDFITDVALAFIAFGVSLGFKTVLIAHITFNIPYVILSVMPKLKQTNRFTYEAALDLGVLSGFLLAFTMSLDDFIITHITRGAGINTLSTLIYSEVRRGIKPSMYALSTVIFVAVLALLLISNFAPKKKQEA